MKFSNFSVLVLTFFLSCAPKNEIKVEYPELTKSLDFEKSKELAEILRKEVNVALDKGLELSLWASDSLVNDPIAISIDQFGKIYYTRAVRQTHSEFDIRAHDNWITASISFETVEDRRKFLRETFSETNEEGQKFLKDLNNDGQLDWRDLTVEKEQVWIIEDRNNDGVADFSRLYLEDFNEEITDVANGIEVTEDAVFIGVGPDLWKTKDSNKDGKADRKESLSHGYAVHIGFGAHGMSGVKLGPDGRIWWGIGDIGANVIDKEGKQWKYPNSGVVVRAELDGSNFEVFASGVRNTHEFTFDEYGNLITEDNDGDHSGERERLVYLIDGSETGWRINWQFGKYTDPKNNSYKVWMDEKLHVPYWDGQAAYILPPIINYVNGPTGFVYNPGTALGEKWKNHFFVSEFRGSPANSPIHAFTLKPKGASFELNQTKEIVQGLLPTGLDFGPDGALYFGDWLDGWNPKNGGKIWKLDVPNAEKNPLRATTQSWIQKDFSKISLGELKDLMGYEDMRVRQKAQFELVRRKEHKILAELALERNQKQLARIHGIWGLSQLARKGDKKTLSPILKLLQDPDEEIIAQTARHIGDATFTDCECEQELISLLKHSSLRVRMLSAEALGKIKSQSAITPILEMLDQIETQDPWLRHAGMIALGRIGNSAELVKLNNDPSLHKRLGAVVALRRMENPSISAFLNDKEEWVVAEAARGINDDYSIPQALSALADILNLTPFQSEVIIRRSINANVRVGNSVNIEQLFQYALNEKNPESLRAEAILALTHWGEPSAFDRVDGRYRGEIKRDDSEVKSKISLLMQQLLKEKSSPVASVIIRALGAFKIEESAVTLKEYIQKHLSPEVRMASLDALKNMESPLLEAGLIFAFSDKTQEVRAFALSLLPQSKISGDAAIALYEKILAKGSIQEKQSAINALVELKTDGVKQILDQLYSELKNGKLEKEIRFDVLEALEKNGQSELVNTYYSEDKLEGYGELLHGGNINKGRRIFYDNQGAQCIRCHAIFEYGGNAGPGLMGVGDRLTNEQILNSLINPSLELSPGFGVTSIETSDGKKISGIILEDSPMKLKLKIGKEDLVEFDKNQIIKREDVPSAMPSMREILTKREIRDLISFLASLKGEKI